MWKSKINAWAIAQAFRCTRLFRTRAERIKSLSSVLDRAAGGITIIDPSLKIVYVNQAQASMHQYSVGELVRKSIDVFCDPDEIRRLHQSIDTTTRIYCSGNQSGLGRLHKAAS